MDFAELLQRSYDFDQEMRELNKADSKLAWVGDSILDFTTYDSSVSDLFAKKALEVALAITNKETFDYHGKTPKNYRWYLLMVNMPFFYFRLNWGGSIRGAWWDLDTEKKCKVGGGCTFVNEAGVQFELSVSHEDWPAFIQALVDFVAEDLKNFEEPDDL